jgi:protein-tyrosine phosphatase
LIDTHCHLLPGLDDGPATDVDAIGLARHLVEQGVETVVCTPHFSRQYRTRWSAAEARLERLRAELATLAIDLETILAAEVSASMAVDAPVEQLVERAIADRYLLVELVRATPAAAIEAIERRLEGIELRPIFAHPERCLAVQQRPEVMSRARARGAVVQIVAPSLGGAWGERVWQSAWQLLESGDADLLGSDAHNAGGTGAFGAVVPLIERRCGGEAAEALTERNPRRLLDGRYAA